MKTESKHTPGPWKVYKMIERWHVGAGNNQYIADVYGCLTSPSEAKANAHLIAKAPEMCAALEKIAARWPADAPEPEEEDYDDTESAYGNGLDVSTYEAAMIARTILAKLEKE